MSKIHYHPGGSAFEKVQNYTKILGSKHCNIVGWRTVPELAGWTNELVSKKCNRCYQNGIIFGLSDFSLPFVEGASRPSGLQKTVKHTHQPSVPTY